jgi:hypothetical protein
MNDHDEWKKHDGLIFLGFIVAVWCVIAFFYWLIFESGLWN